MSSFFMLVVSIIAGFIIGFIILRKKNYRLELYCEGIRNENDGRYDMALHNYEDAVDEIRKFRWKKSLVKKITGRIKSLRATIEYEKNFQVNIEM